MAFNGPAYTGLVRERTTAINNIQLLQNETAIKGTDWTVAQLNARLDVLEGYWTRFQQAQRQLVMEHSDIEVVADTLDDVEQTTLHLYADTKASMNQCKTLLQAITAPQPRTLRPSEIKVSTFSGRYTEWAAWRSEFKAKVLDTPLNASDKITLLLGALTKEAANCAGRAERLDTLELDRIWAKLDKTYDNKYQQVYAHIAKIVNISPMTQPSADKLRAIIDTVDQHLRMLQRFDIQTDHWGPIVCVLLLEKLDVDTRNQWESKDSLPAMPDLNALFTYLEQRILAIRNTEQSAKRVQQSTASISTTKSGKTGGETKQRFHPYDRKQQPAASGHSISQQNKLKPLAPNCPQCGNDVRHYLWRCDAFRALTSAAQIDQIKKWGICEICLKESHKPSECTKGACPICKSGRHNSLICPQGNAKNINHTRGGKRSRSHASQE